MRRPRRLSGRDTRRRHGDSRHGFEQVRQNADIALYHAKEHARGQFVEFDPGLGTALTRRFRAVRDVNLALSENRIEAYYQPIVRLDMGLAVTSEWMFAPELAAGTVQRVLPEWSLPTIDLWAVYPSGRLASTKARAFADFVEGILAE